MEPLVGLITDTTAVEFELLLVAFVLCSLIGLERQLRQKAAGFRTHVLVGMGSCAFTLVSVFGFSAVLGDDVVLDPSRIAAQIVSGIGFLGAGVIFKGRNVVRGLTTAATIWVAAAVGMACGAGMLSLGVLLTGLHLVTLFLVAPLVRRLPSPDSKRLLRITYADGAGVLRDVLEVATAMGFTSSIEHSRRTTEQGRRFVIMDIRFHGRPPMRDLIPQFIELEGVERVALRASGEESYDDEQD
ncbi:MgtC/SapB family protein [Brachybacterium alimentarium]|uniref:MgtC/SapB family protein n=1 Tax=Brachybacterium alimentarium TaxID=47845 RepID=UPI000DF3A0F2|nr:MgtC/SapB family protein [Brachybacterium alimentarium]RCS74271.1 MgtC/SapB family protein [Brachybacterium alimentarium]RCS78230.1 MgtC/SapB family protein [Brachybacterium alimentarium]RCS82350.1 MgtC/SapB family protein [Brachybacterium alimentarium]